MICSSLSPNTNYTTLGLAVRGREEEVVCVQRPTDTAAASEDFKVDFQQGFGARCVAGMVAKHLDALIDSVGYNEAAIMCSQE